MWIAKEGFREIAFSGLILGALATAANWVWWPLATPFLIVWIWVVAFFRDPPRSRRFAAGELCSPADGTVTEIAELAHHELIGGPAVRVGIFLSLFNVHINRSPCSGRVRSLSYRAGEFLDARHPESGARNESNTLLIDTDAPLPGPVEVRQVAGLVARRIICHAEANGRLSIGERFGLIKFGSRTELVIPRSARTTVVVRLGERVQAGLTVIARQDVETPVRKAERTELSSTAAVVAAAG
ncbi:MAG: phosphatidylserine decarboxylase [Planctomycetota bacterium]